VRLETGFVIQGHNSVNFNVYHKHSTYQKSQQVKVSLGYLEAYLHLSTLYNSTHTSMTAEDLLVDDGGDRQAVEAVRERLPELDVVASPA